MEYGRDKMMSFSQVVGLVVLIAFYSVIPVTWRTTKASVFHKLCVRRVLSKTSVSIMNLISLESNFERAL